MTKPTNEVVLEALGHIHTLIEKGALDPRDIARVLRLGGLIPLIEGEISKAMPATAAIMASLLVCARSATLPDPTVESNVQHHTRKMIDDAHTYALAKAGFYVDAASGSLVQVCRGDLETQAKCLGDSILSHAGKLSVAAHADHLA